MNAYMVVGPTNVQPRFFNSFDSAMDSLVVAIDAGCPTSAFSGAMRDRLETPDEIRQRTALVDELAASSRVVDSALDLAAMADDPFVLEQPLDVLA